MGKVRIIGGKWRGRQIDVPTSADLRPTPDRVRETVFNWLMHHIEGARCLDLFAGSGALGFEALSRSAAFVVFVEKEKKSLSQLQQVAQILKCERHCEIVGLDAIAWLKQHSQDKAFDVIFLDPPFDSSLLQESFILLAQSNLIAPHTLLYVESKAPLKTEQVPASWQILKHKKAGEVFYHLIQGGR